jgi:hypothetical protein
MGCHNPNGPHLPKMPHPRPIPGLRGMDDAEDGLALRQSRAGWAWVRLPERPSGRAFTPRRMSPPASRVNLISWFPFPISRTGLE